MYNDDDPRLLTPSALEAEDELKLEEERPSVLSESPASATPAMVAKTVDFMF